jgi:hypothetical protein
MKSDAALSSNDQSSPIFYASLTPTHEKPPVSQSPIQWMKAPSADFSQNSEASETDKLAESISFAPETIEDDKILERSEFDKALDDSSVPSTFMNSYASKSSPS